MENKTEGSPAIVCFEGDGNYGSFARCGGSPEEESYGEKA